MPASVRQVALPGPARGRSTLPRLDYTDAFVVQAASAQERTAEQWARAMLEGASAATRNGLRWGWSVLGLQLGSTRSAELVLGWELRRSTPEHVLLAARSRLGMVAELLFERRRRTLLYATLLRHENPLARAVWAGVAPWHRVVVRQVLEDGRARTVA